MVQDVQKSAGIKSHREPESKTTKELVSAADFNASNESLMAQQTKQKKSKSYRVVQSRYMQPSLNKTQNYLSKTFVGSRDSSDHQRSSGNQPKPEKQISMSGSSARKQKASTPTLEEKSLFLEDISTIQSTSIMSCHAAESQVPLKGVNTKKPIPKISKDQSAKPGEKADKESDALKVHFAYTRYLQYAFLNLKAGKAIKDRDEAATSELSRLWHVMESQREELSKTESDVGNLRRLRLVEEVLGKTEPELNAAASSLPEDYSTLSGAIGNTLHQLPVKDIVVPQSESEREKFEKNMRDALCESGSILSEIKEIVNGEVDQMGLFAKNLSSLDEYYTETSTELHSVEKELVQASSILPSLSRRTFYVSDFLSYLMVKMETVKLLAVLSAALALVSADFVTVYLRHDQGVKGATRRLRDGTVISIFKNIPFGNSTAGNNRFDAPVEAEPWTGVIDALAFGGRCMQINDSIAPPGQYESEDCLNLNIYTPDVNGSLPVMVFIHGGGFDSGSGSYSMYEGSSLAARGVVVVTVNYRLGIFGFLSTGDDVMPGNYGMLDQVLALKWVHRYIREFGGDPNEVTIFGESAGSACVSLHLTSPLSKGLFKRAIMESGVSLSAWAAERPATLVKLADYAKEIGAKVGCKQTSSQEFLTCIRGVDAYSLVVAGEDVQEEFGVEILATPRVETKFGFLPEYPEDLLAKGQFHPVDTLRGYNSGEYAFVINDTENDGVTREEFIEFFLKISENYAFENSTVESLKEIIEHAYLKNQTDKMALRTSLIRGLTDLLFATSEVLDLDKQLSAGHGNSRHYLYQFNYVIESLLNVQSFLPKWMGATHTSELPLVFRDDSALANLLAPQAQKTVGELVQTLWTNFAKYGDPTKNGTSVQWAPYTTAGRELLMIDVAPTMSSYPSPDFVSIYEKILALLRNKIDISAILD
ncbi:hypothetical protein Btru_009935 [Bulinus truncatus]|nr:hypothetical protein Btru_009935 [Bulinus truncatus]